MASERALKAGAGIAAAALAPLGAVAACVADSPRLLVLCALGGTIAAVVLWRLLARLTVRRPLPEAVLPTRAGTDDALLALEARLEHAPMALFRVDGLAGEGSVAPLNGDARRLLAPGRASEPERLCALLAAQPADQRTLIGFDTERGLERALVAVSALTVQGCGQRLVALLPVESQLEAEALNAWRQLVHVLTHEIMNSLTPVASLSRTAREMLHDVALPPEVDDDIGTALDAIARRSASLVDFVASYRSLSTLPRPRPERIRLVDLFARLEALVGPDWQARGGSVRFAVEPASLEVLVDPGQLEQALINLLNNAAEATAQVAQPRVEAVARLGRGGRLRIEVSDNGPGVPDDTAPHIFTPFFSTKKQGRGIGLAMVRQLVHGNGGTVRHARSVTSGARFIVSF
ncbi:PAS domain-containing sensor histidine kinase [Massilia sp. YMA4]|uniref:sensor histidine kinase n=1 Tax=Massilia sp. YMA4 TaxID=1593482 RepID=UPI000DD17184|nr:ATP-binding protein [Massilia sp. YMA4]AXA93138.1 ATP-binding protein [Massilia sp. YMA4]